MTTTQGQSGQIDPSPAQEGSLKPGPSARLMLPSQILRINYLKRALAEGADPNRARNPFNDEKAAEWTPLMYAAHRGKADCVAALIEAGANPEFRLKEEDRSPLLLACDEGHLGCVQELLLGGAKTGARPGPKMTAFESALVAALRSDEAASEKCVEALLSAGADPNEPDCWGESPLLLAMRLGRANVMRSLILAGACPDARGILPQTARELAESFPGLRDAFAEAAAEALAKREAVELSQACQSAEASLAKRPRI